ncbi:MAG: secF, partial [Propionibacteriaceae bacterium]|nr:secF [Propionibacteriaceae bacterium]
KDLALALFVGMVSGAYSSIFIATPILAQLKEREPDMQKLTARVATRRAKEAQKAGGDPERAIAASAAIAAGAPAAIAPAKVVPAAPPEPIRDAGLEPGAIDPDGPAANGIDPDGSDSGPETTSEPTDAELAAAAISARTGSLTGGPRHRDRPAGVGGAGVGRPAGGLSGAEVTRVPVVAELAFLDPRNRLAAHGLTDVGALITIEAG